jgi:hypothetical protein
MEDRVLSGDCSDEVFNQHQWMLANREFSSDDESDHSDDALKDARTDFKGFIGATELRMIVQLTLKSLADNKGGNMSAQEHTGTFSSSVCAHTATWSVSIQVDICVENVLYDAMNIMIYDDIYL